MTSILFPANPDIGDTFESGGVIFSWTGEQWISAVTDANFIGVTGSTGATGIGVTGPQGDSITGATGPTSDKVEVVQSLDEDTEFSVLFADGSETSGVTTVFKDSGGLSFNPFINRIIGRQAQFESTVNEFTVSYNEVLRFTDISDDILDGYVCTGSWGEATISTELTAQTVFATDISGYTQADIHMYGRVNATGAIVNARFTLYLIQGTDGFLLTDHTGGAFPFPSPIDTLTAYNGVFPDPTLGMFYQRDAANPTRILLGFYTKVAGTYDVQWKIRTSKLSTGSVAP